MPNANTTTCCSTALLADRPGSATRCCAVLCCADTRAYTARYDRVYMRGLSAAELRLVADKEQTPGRGDFLSDHFGLLARLEVLQGQPASPGQPDKEQPASPAGQKRGSGGLQERRRVRSCRRG